MSFVNDGNADGVPNAGETVHYSFVVTNTGDVAVDNLVINDATIGVVGLVVTPSSLAPGQVGLAEYNYAITQANIDAGQIVNSATVSGDTGGTPVTDISDNDGTGESDPTITPLQQVRDIVVIKTGAKVDEDGDGIYEAGEHITWTFAITNTGNTTV
ncbi:hypothetical protein [Flavobacterium sp. N1718]|uniref:DUF7507 domain-containing protein n=1 Tax=Flavobacterium sp. N1718 TaxID=2986822 RepID=UPI002224B684|nr:hypothetical protein [Flavobacterium sp. N1718]